MANPSARAAVENWRRYPGSLSTKLKLALRNNAIKVRTVSDCCGHHGEPGC